MPSPWLSTSSAPAPAADVTLLKQQLHDADQRAAAARAREERLDAEVQALRSELSQARQDVLVHVAELQSARDGVALAHRAHEDGHAEGYAAGFAAADRELHDATTAASASLAAATGRAAAAELLLDGERAERAMFEASVIELASERERAIADAAALRVELDTLRAISTPTSGDSRGLDAAVRRAVAADARASIAEATLAEHEALLRTRMLDVLPHCSSLPSTIEFLQEAAFGEPGVDEHVRALEQLHALLTRLADQKVGP
jgi:chromosome segregation ATPase